MLLTPAYTPNYDELIKSSPEYLAYQANNPTVSAGATRRAAVQALALQFGGQLPAGYQDTYGDLTPDIMAQAAANPFSQIAGLRRSSAQAGQQLQTSLAARGALHSGDLVYGADQLAQQLGQAEYDAGNAFGGAYQGDVGAFTDAMNNWQGQLPGVLSAAQQSLEANPLYQPHEAVYAQLVDNWNALYGQPIYQNGPGGTLYAIGPDGNLVAYTPGSAPPAPPPYNPFADPSGYVPASGTVGHIGPPGPPVAV